MKSITLPPYAPTLIESTRAIGYTLEAAIADIVDNSISASASCVDIFFFPIGDSYIAILDDGVGMTAEELEVAMRYGSQNPNEKRDANDLGRFGLGLKTASLSQCRTMTVVTKQGNLIEGRRWDIDHVAHERDWSLLVLDTEEEFADIPRIEELRKLKSGTLVVWQNLDRLMVGEIDFSRSMAKKMDDVRSHLSLVFHRYISGEAGLKRIVVRMNNTPIEPADPFLTKRHTQVMDDEVLEIEGAKVVITPYILPHFSTLSTDELLTLGGKDGLRKRQGFYVYRNKRLLIWGTWFRMIPQDELSKLARVRVDIPNELDNLWTLDIKKSRAMPPEEVRNNLDSVIKRLAQLSRNTSVARGKREARDTIVHIWERSKGRQGGSFYSINRDHPLIELMQETATPKVMRTLESLLKTIESGLPLNLLYLDLNSDKPVENDTDTTLHEVDEILRGMIDQMPNELARMQLLERLANSEPFVNYPQLITRYQGGTSNGGNKR
jgi:hypothetical protein